MGRLTSRQSQQRDGVENWTSHVGYNLDVLGSCDPIAFCATTNASRAREFYERVLGLRLVADEPVALAFDANGVMLRVTKVRSLTPAGYTVLGWRVDDIAATVQALADEA